MRRPKLPKIKVPEENGKSAIIMLIAIFVLVIIIVINVPKIMYIIGTTQFQLTNESISVVQCFSFQNQNGLITIVAYVQNIGKSNAVITSAYLYDQNGLEDASNTSLSVKIPPGKALPIYIQTFALTPGNLYKVSVYTEVGTYSSCELTYQ
ncbi:hypothetical protein [Caldisphaera sp.]|uniref:hypothetical protein n=1 Tax=Caldisphaera sp. TaxID=2060322 RepID=UPI0025BAE8E8|nr:hypothetical protein [Caldisphaera sp.]